MRKCAKAGILMSAFLGLYNAVNFEEDAQDIVWETYSDDVFVSAKDSKHAIFLDFTASWCLNCQFNERLFRDQEIIKLFKDNHVKTIKCDWTNKNENITNLMKRYGAVAIPLYIYYPGDDRPHTVLPTILTKNLIKQTLQRGHR
jgi:thiol:disulfide interchange protein DsbD